MSSNRDTVARTLLVAFLVCIACSVMVAVAVVSLQEAQVRNKTLDRQRNILVAAGLFDPARHGNRDVETLFSAFEVVFIDLDHGRLATEAELSAAGVNPATYDQYKAARTPALSRAIDPADDLAMIRRQARFAQAYLVREGDSIKTLVLPVNGYGLWSTLYGFLAVAGDGNTVVGFGFYQHGETPGLGGEVDNPRWTGLWPGKQLYDSAAQPAITVVKGVADPAHPEAVHQIDGLSGATLTSKGVENLVRFWTGPQGYGAVLDKLRTGVL